MLNELDEERLDKWRWQAFVGEEASLESLYQEAPDTPSKRCLTKVGGWVRLGGGGMALMWWGSRLGGGDLRTQKVHH